MGQDGRARERVAQGKTKILPVLIDARACGALLAADALARMVQVARDHNGLPSSSSRANERMRPIAGRGSPDRPQTQHWPYSGSEMSERLARSPSRRGPRASRAAARSMSAWRSASSAHRIRRWRRAGRREPSPLRLRHGPAAVARRNAAVCLYCRDLVPEECLQDGAPHHT
jgi:hypothetical protein